MRTLIAGCRVFDGHAVVHETANVVVEGNTIREVSPRVQSGEFDLAMDGVGKTLMPGLIDAHVHVYAYDANLSRNDSASVVARVLHAEQFMSSALMRGFTSLRDAGGADHELEAALKAGMFQGPRLFRSGLALSQTGGHGDMRMAGVRLCGCGYTGAISLIADGEDEVRHAAREQLRWGASQVKIMASGGASSPTDPISMLQYSEAEIRVAIEEARRWDTYVMAHAYTPGAIERCIRLGVRTIEHGNHIDAATAGEVVRQGAFVVPTLATYDALLEGAAAQGWGEDLLAKVRQVQEAGLDSLRICRQAGVRLGFGTDLLGGMHMQQCNEFMIRSKVLPPIEILRSATSVNAEILNRGNDLGAVRPGALADLILVDGKPDEDLSLFQADGRFLSMVMRDGVIVKNRSLS